MEADAKLYPSFGQNISAKYQSTKSKFATVIILRKGLRKFKPQIWQIFFHEKVKKEMTGQKRKKTKLVPSILNWVIPEISYRRFSSFFGWTLVELLPRFEEQEFKNKELEFNV